MKTAIASFFERLLSHLRDLSFRHSEENKAFTKNKVIAHQAYMAGYRKTTPYLHPDNWQDDREGNLLNME